MTCDGPEPIYGIVFDIDRLLGEDKVHTKI